MSDTPESYTNLDLETAEQLLIAAGKIEMAQALHHHAHGIRNLVQGEWGRSFVASLEGLLTKHVDPLVEGQKETHSGIAALSGQFQTLVETVDELQASMHASQVDRQAMRAELAVLQSVVDQHSEKLAQLHMDHEERITSLEDYRAEMQAMRDALAELSARIGGALPTEADQELSAELRREAAGDA